MDIFKMHYNYENKYLFVIIDTTVYVYKNKICKFDPPLFSFQAKKCFYWYIKGLSYDRILWCS